jgi:hypothetical protein
VSDAEQEFAEQSLGREQGRYPRMRLTQVQFRLGSRFISVWWLAPGVVLLGGALVVAFKVFIATRPGSPSFTATRASRTHRGSSRACRPG